MHIGNDAKHERDPPLAMPASKDAVVGALRHFQRTSLLGPRLFSFPRALRRDLRDRA